MAPGKKKTRRRMSWDEWYKLAKEYRDSHDDLLIPRDYVCDAGQKLGRRIERQRTQYNDVSAICANLDRTQISLLNQIDMVWKLENRFEWNDWLIQLDCLGNWIKEQRKRYMAYEMTEGEINDLNTRGIHWSLRVRHRSWEEWYADAVAYHKEHDHLMVPQDYRTPRGDRLGIWI